jgi:hypothetical protein
MEDTLVENQRLGDEGGFAELDIRISGEQTGQHKDQPKRFGPNSPLRLPRELIQQYRNPIYRPTALEMGLNLLWRRGIVDIAHKDTPRINLFFILPQTLRLLLQRLLHFAQFGCFGLHLGDPALHRGDFFLFGF